jgi:PAS domain S-box-containing protein
MGMAIRPKVGMPWQFGVHQCCRERVWTPEEELLFREIGRRLTDALTGLLVRRDLRESQRRLAEAQRIAHVGYWERDFDAQTITLSDESCRIFGSSPGDVPIPLREWHSRWMELIHPGDQPRLRQAAEDALRDGLPYDVEYRVVRSGGEVRFVHSEGVVNQDAAGRPVSMTGMMQDITERKTAEKEIRRLNLELEQRVADRTSELEASNQELEAFAYSVSHDLRAPLRHVDGFVHLLANRIAPTEDEDARHYMDVIAESAARMGQLIDDLLAFSRMGRAEMARGRVELDPLVREAVAELAPEAAGRKVRWRVAELPAVIGDRMLLRTVLDNLLGNALKFTRPREVAEIEVGWQPGDAGEIVIYVRDNGVGFDPSYANKLFGVFQRLHRSDDFEGTGIGLANVHRIVARHGGRTWARGTSDGGATFFFSLPAPEEDE